MRHRFTRPQNYEYVLYLSTRAAVFPIHRLHIFAGSTQRGTLQFAGAFAVAEPVADAAPR